MRIALMILTVLSLSTSVLAQRAIIATTDFSTGSLSQLDLTTDQATNDLLLIHSDAAVATHGDHVYILNKLNSDNVIVLGKDDLATPITQYSTGNGSNPHDIAFISNEKAYISLYAHDYLLVVNPTTGDSLGTIDVSGFADNDGLPEISQLAVFGSYVFVSAQRLDRDAFFAPSGESTIIVIDAGSDTLVDVDAEQDGIQGITLEGANPTSVIQRGGHLIVATVGSFGAQDGGIEVVNLVTMSTEGRKVTEEALEGDVGAMAMISDTEGYIVVSDANFANSVKRFSLATGMVSATLPDHSTGYTPGLAVAGTSLYVLDQGTFSNPELAGVGVYDTSTNTRIAGPISSGLPPSDIVFVDLNPADYDDDGAADFDDFLLFAGAFGKRLGEAEYDSRFDLQADGLIDFSDFLVFAGHYGG